MSWCTEGLATGARLVTPQPTRGYLIGAALAARRGDGDTVPHAQHRSDRCTTEEAPDALA